MFRAKALVLFSCLNPRTEVRVIQLIKKYEQSEAVVDNL
jgi:hypothetical protein